MTSRPPTTRRASVPRARRAAALAILLLIGTAAAAAAHDMFVKPASFYVAEGSALLVRLINGTFSKSENAIARPRILDVSVVSPAGRARVDTSEWSAEGDTSAFSMTTGEGGTYVIGVSTRPNVIALDGKDFNEYLRSDGIPDVLAERTRAGELGKGVRERYAKHVKALIQVGSAKTDHFDDALGYPAEIIPLENPYASSRGTGSYRMRTLVDGAPVANQLVMYGGRTPSGARIAPRHVRSDAEGIATIPITRRGTWYVKFIHMAKTPGDSVDYESKWASLTFQVR